MTVSWLGVAWAHGRILPKAHVQPPPPTFDTPIASPPQRVCSHHQHHHCHLQHHPHQPNASEQLRVQGVPNLHQGCNIAVYCCVPPGTRGVDLPEFIVPDVPLHGWGLSVCKNYPCRYPCRPMRLFPSVDCCVVRFASLSDPYQIAKGCDTSKSPSVHNIGGRFECDLWTVQSFSTCPQSRCAFLPAS